MNGSQPEPGAIDDRLSLNPSQHPFVEDWEDGKRYPVKALVEQISPGEYRVIEAQPDGESPADEEAEPVPGANAEAKGSGEYSNPAVDRLMSGGKQTDIE